MKTPHNNQWYIATFNKSVVFERGDGESWLFNPPLRYILNGNIIDMCKDHVSPDLSDLATSSKHNPLSKTSVLAGSSILIDRYRERGIGDLLFLTGAIHYLNHVTSGDINIYVYALLGRGSILDGNPGLHDNKVYSGPVLYDSLSCYDYHWFISSVTEFDAEPDQLNVYDALFKQLGLDHRTIDSKFKRPYIYLTPYDNKSLDQVLYNVFVSRGIDLRRSGFYVVAPFATSSSRSMPYATWLKVIEILSSRKPTLVVGNINYSLPTIDMAAGDFIKKIGSITNAIDLTGKTGGIRTLASLISVSNGVVCLDSGPLYIAQGLRIPAVSVWGTHNPRVRIGYDKDYMDRAIWNKSACINAPCYAYSGFPASKCSQGSRQVCCDVLSASSPEEICSKLE